MNLRIFLAHAWYDPGLVSVSYPFVIITRWWNLSGSCLASESCCSLPLTGQNSRRVGEKDWVTLLSQGLERQTAAHLHPEIIACKVRAFRVGCVSCNFGMSSCLLNQWPNSPAQQVMNMLFHLLLLSSARSAPKSHKVFLTLTMCFLRQPCSALAASEAQDGGDYTWSGARRPVLG